MYPTLLTSYALHFQYFHHTIILFLLHLYALCLCNQFILQGQYINMDSEADAGSQEGQGEKKDDSPPWWKV